MALRSIKGRLDWFLSHRPSAAGLCARYTWLSLGNPPPPALGTPDATAVIKRMKALGYWETSRKNIPRGAIVGYTGGRNGHGHLCLAYTPTTIASTDVHGPRTVGVVDLGWPERHWGLKYAGWTWHWGKVELKGSR